MVVVELIDLFEGGEFYGVEVVLWFMLVDDFGFEQFVDCFGQSIVVVVVDVVDGWFNVCFGQLFGVVNRQIL